MLNKTKIVATVGPSSNTKTVLKNMILSGMNVVRLNFSHGKYDEHTKAVNLIRSLSREMNRYVGIILDLQGPKIRTGLLQGGNPVELKKDEIIAITSRQVPGTSAMVSTTYKKIAKDVTVGDKILMDDGLIALRVLSKTENTVTCKIINGGILKEHKGINLPGVNVSAPSLTDKDIKDLNFGIKLGVDYFALSFVRRAKDLEEIKLIIKKQGADIPVIAKIEKPEAVENLDEILKTADGVMVARGDLGVELNPEQVPGIQKQIIHKAINSNKIVITATQMLETMINNPVPTRAEASDVANAVYDGTDAVMLSGETALGKYPVEAVQMMTKIITESEKTPFMKYNLKHEKNSKDLVTQAVAQSSVHMLHGVDAATILAFSVSGKTSKLISKQRPEKLFFSCSPSEEVNNRMSLMWGVVPLLIPEIYDTKRIIEAGENIILGENYIKKGDLIVIVTGLALKTGSTNIIKLHRAGDEEYLV
ncbi:MAG TPA: pyruvate kinase [Desulfobacteraceae bacterium]|nr:pyruvate kinase [Desulfobacteraceae bacterium]